MARNSIILNGKSSDTITGLLIQELPPISKPLMRSQVEEIDGRDGDIITKLGFSAYDKEISVGLYGNFNINEIIAYFNSEGTVTFSNEPDKFYYYQILEQIDFERLVRFRTATINFHVQPFKYSTTEEAETIEAGTVSGEGNNLVLENTSDAPFSKLTPKGDAYQQTYEGNNLVNRSVATPNARLVWSSAADYADTGSVTTDYIAVSENNSYIANYSVNVFLFAVSKDYVGVLKTDGSVAKNNAGNPNYNGVFTIPSGLNVAYMRVVFRASQTTNPADLTDKDLSVNAGSTVLPYEPYVGGTPSPNPDYPQDIQVVTGEQTIKVSGKNLLLLNNRTITSHGINYAFDSNGTITLNGLSDAISTATDQSTSLPLHFEAGKTYTVSANNPSANNDVFVRFYPGGIHSFRLGDPNASITFTETVDRDCRLEVRISSGVSLSDFIIKPMIELSSTASDYEPYQSQSYPISLGSTELCGIGKKPDGTYTYQDYIWEDGDTWKVHKETERIVFDGSESGWGINGTGTESYFYRFRYIEGYDYSSSNNRWYSNQASPANISSSNTNEGCYITGAGEVRIRYGAGLSLDDFKAYLATNPIILDYALTAPTDTAITDETLISQLEALNAAHAYKGRTHIISTAGSDANLPHIIEAKVLGSSDTTITNAGNFISKPKFTIYGSGNIGLYINGIQILQIALGDEQYITIDAAQMEAYKDTLDNLKNRLVTGDYTNLALNPGENQISFSGQVEKYIVENYSRWL